MRLPVSNPVSGQFEGSGVPGPFDEPYQADDRCQQGDETEQRRQAACPRGRVFDIREKKGDERYQEST
jgi:hypothetical protein